MNKVLWWAPTPWEHDGGAVVDYYLWQEMNFQKPELEMHVIPKVWGQATPEQMPYLKWHSVGTKYFGEIPKKIPQIMKKHKIDTLIMFHIPWEYFPIIDEVHKMGGQVINHQTIHWRNDVLFMSDKLHDFDWWVPPTQYAKNVLAEVGGVDKSKMLVIPHGVDMYRFFAHGTQFRDSLRLKPNQKVILFVGRAQLTKGIVPMMLATRKLCNDFNCHVVFKAGVHGGVTKAREMAYLLNKMTTWDKRIHFLPNWYSTDFAEDLIASCDILACPSGHEGFSLPPLEAMACGKPVAVTDIPVHRELIGGQGKCGLLMPPSDHTEYVNDVQSVTVPNKDMIYGTLKWLLENPDEAEVMGQNGLARVKKYYDLEKISGDWIKLLEKL